MSYASVLIGITFAGAALLAWLVVGDLLAAQRSSLTLSVLKTASEDLVPAELELLKAAGEEVGESGAQVAEEFIRRLRRMEEKKTRAGERTRFAPDGTEFEEDRREREDLERYRRVVRLINDTFVTSGLAEQEFPLRAYSSANTETRRSVRQLIAIMRSEREATKAGISAQ